MRAPKPAHYNTCLITRSKARSLLFPQAKRNSQVQVVATAGFFLLATGVGDRSLVSILFVWLCCPRRQQKTDHSEGSIVWWAQQLVFGILVIFKALPVDTIHLLLKRVLPPTASDWRIQPKVFDPFPG